MFTRELIFIEQFVSDFNGRQYEMFKFVDPITLRILYGTNLVVKELEKGKKYNCTLEYKRSNKIDTFVISEIK